MYFGEFGGAGEWAVLKISRNYSSTVVDWGYKGAMEKNMETTTMGFSSILESRDGIIYSNRCSARLARLGGGARGGGGSGGGGGAVGGAWEA